MNIRPTAAHAPTSARAAGNTTGQLTAVMRAARAVSLPRVLRVGIVQGGRIVSERLCESFPFTIGEMEDASVIVAGVPQSHALFTKRHDSQGKSALELCIAAGMKGRVLTDEGAFDLESVAAVAARSGRAARIVLGESARGRVDIGRTRILFQFVERPAARTTPKLPLAVKNGHRIDWSLAMICAMSFLAHFGVLGMMYSDWADPIVNESYTVGALIDMGHQLPQAPIEEAQPDPKKPTDNEEATKKEVAKKEANDQPSRDKSKHDANPAPSKQNDPTLMADRADGMMLGILTATKSSAPATEAALRRSEVPAIDLRIADGNITPESELRFHSQAPIEPGKSHDISTLGNTHAVAQNDKQVARDVAVPFTFDVPPPTLTVHVDHIDRTIAQLRPGFRKCYTDGLSRDASQQGQLVIRAKIAPTGEVANATVMSNTGLSADVAECIARKVRNADFEAPGGTGSTVDIPVKFVKQ